MQSEVLDTVIGVVFVWFLLSTVLAAIDEALALIVRARSKHLWLGIGRLIDPRYGWLPKSVWDVAYRLGVSGKRDLRPTAGGEGQARKRIDRFMANWSKRPDTKITDENFKELRIRTQTLYDQLGPHLVEIAKPSRLSKVTRLAPSAFSEAVLTVAQSVSWADIRAEATRTGWEAARVAALERRLGNNAVIDLATLLEGVDDVAERAELSAIHADAAARLSVRDVVAYFHSNPELSAALRRAAGAVGAEERVAAMRRVIESRFERQMDQLSGLYRRHTRKMLGVLAVPLVVLCHANAIEIYGNLRHDFALRQAVLTGALTTAAEDPIQDAVEATCLPPTTSTTATKPSDPTTSTTIGVLDDAAAKLSCAAGVLDRAEKFRIGIAWQEIKEAHGETGSKSTWQWGDVWPYLRHVVTDQFGWFGRLLTLAALMFGAQFWFDILRRLTGVRAALSKGSTQRAD